LPLVKLEQWIMVGTEVMWGSLGGNGRVEHAAEGDTIDLTGMHTETDNAPCELIHDDEHPVALQKNRFTPKQVDAPKAVLRVSSDGEP